MGCGTSAERGDGSASQKYADSVVDLSSEQQQLFEELAKRTNSHCSVAEEPSETVRSLRFQSVVSRGKLMNGITADPDQFSADAELPEFKKRDRRRVDEWTKHVFDAQGLSGPERLPEGFFFSTPQIPEHNVAPTGYDSSRTVDSDGSFIHVASGGRQRSSGGVEYTEHPSIGDTSARNGAITEGVCSIAASESAPAVVTP